MAVSKKELQLSQDLMTLQQQYNQAVKRNLELRKEIGSLSETLRKDRLAHEVEVERLERLVDRAVKFEAPSTTAKRRKKEASNGGSI